MKFINNDVLINILEEEVFQEKIGLIKKTYAKNSFCRRLFKGKAIDYCLLVQ